MNSDADAHGRADVLTPDARVLREGAQDAGGEGAGLGGGRGGAVDEPELIATQASHDSPGAHERAEHIRDVPEHLVADLRREDVVDVLEAIEIDDEQGELRSPDGSSADLVLEKLLEVLPMRRPRQGIESKKLGQPFGFLLGLVGALEQC
jgi:hypothetical protein